MITKETTRIIFNVDKKLKERAQKVAEKEGVTLTSYLSLALSDFASGKKVMGIIEPVFEEEKATKEDIKAIKEAEKEFREGKYITSEELFKKYNYKSKFVKSKK